MAAPPIATESSTLSRLLQHSRLPESYASSMVLVHLEREMALSPVNTIHVPPPMNLKPWGSQLASRLEIRRTASTPTAPLARSPTTPDHSRQPSDPWGSRESPARFFQEGTKSEIGVREVRDRAAGFRSRTPSADSDSVRGFQALTRTSSTAPASTESERTAPAEATSSKPQRTLVSHAMAEQHFEDP